MIAPGDWPLVGRATELQYVAELMFDDEARGVVIAGPAGVGKSRLALESLRAAEHAGLATALAMASRAASDLPFGALAPLLPAADPAKTAVERSDLLRRSAAAIKEAAGGRRLVFYVDDAHHLDDASALLVNQLAMTNSAFVLATVRTGEHVPDPIVALWKDGIAERIELAGLDVDAIDELLEAYLKAPAERATIAQLAARSEGNVLYFRELVLGALADGTLIDDGGVWRLVGPLRPSERLLELIDARLGELDPDERRLLEVVSYGQPLGQAEVQRILDAELAEQLERKGLLTSRLDGRRLELRLAHPAYDLRERIPALRSREIARSLAQAVESTGARRREDVLRVATWRLEGGGGDPDMMLAAAVTARWRYDYPLAERLAGAAVAYGAGFEAKYLLAQLAYLQGRIEEADKLLGQLEALTTDPARLGAIAVSRLDCVGFFRGQMEEGLERAKLAEASNPDPSWRDEIAARRAAVEFAISGPRRMAEVSVPLLDRAQGRAFAWACIVAAMALARLGRTREALDVTERGYAAHVALTTPMEWSPWMHLFLRCEALAQAGHVEAAETLALEQYRLGVDERSGERQAEFSWHLALAVGERGHVRTAARHAREGMALFRERGRTQYVRECGIGLVLALALGNEGEKAAQQLHEIEEMDLPPTPYKVIDLMQAQAWTAAANGDLFSARELLEQGARKGETIGDLVGAASSLHGLARLGRAKQVVGRLDDLATVIDGRLASARAAHARGLVNRDAESLLDTGEAFATMGADLLAAEAFADAAAIWERAGDARSAAVAKRRAADMVARCEGASTPALRQVDTNATLTPAEREAAALAASGFTNRQIADRCHLSIRTVENRLQHVYEKLGIRNRNQLQEALRDTG